MPLPDEPLLDEPLLPDELPDEPLEPGPVLDPAVPLGPVPAEPDVVQVWPVTVSLPFTQLLELLLAIRSLVADDDEAELLGDVVSVLLPLLDGELELLLDGELLVVEELLGDLVLLRSPIARAPALPSAKMEMKNTGASLRIKVSLRSISFGLVMELPKGSLPILVAIAVPCVVRLYSGSTPLTRKIFEPGRRKFRHGFLLVPVAVATLVSQP